MTVDRHSSAEAPPAMTDFGFDQVPEAEKAGRVGEVFASVAGRYDLMNDVLSGGLHRLWKDALVAWARPDGKSRDFHHVDVAGGTGDIAYRMVAAGGDGVRSLVLDINPEMIGAGRDRPEAKARDDQISFAVGDAECLPLADRSVDLYTIGFGIRNVTRRDAALAEAERVLRIGGRFLCLEFSHVDIPLLDTAYELFSMKVIPELGSAIAGDREAYRYLVESIRRFPDQPAFAGEISDAGFGRITWRNLSGGIAAIHSAWRL